MARKLIEQRKADHLDLAASGQVDFRCRTTLLEHVQLMHEALPEASVDEVDLRTEFLGRTFSAPLMVTGMTGGTPRARQINCDLARAAQALDLPFGLGSQRAMVLHPELTGTFDVREAAPRVFLIGNIGLQQARQMPTAKVQEMLRSVGADALAVHLNPAMELVQVEGDRDFRGGIRTLERLRAELGLPIVVKETGCGLSQRALEALLRIGITNVDVAGAGGTSWVGVEARRALGTARTLGEEFWDWGIPTAVAIVLARQARMTVIGSGGIRSGLDCARALALGAHLAGLAAPVLRAQAEGGTEGAARFLTQLIEGLRTALFLSGCARPADLPTRPKVIVGELKQWMDQLAVK